MSLTAHEESLIEMLRNDVASLASKIESIEKRLFIGNGDPPVMTRIDRIEQARKDHDEQVKTMAQKRDNWTRGIALIVFAQTCALVASFFIHKGGP